jgi:heme exporter protein D
MMPDLGRYAVEVSAAYIVSLALIVLLVAWYVLRGRAMRRQLDEVEKRRGKNG